MGNVFDRRRMNLCNSRMCLSFFLPVASTRTRRRLERLPPLGLSVTSPASDLPDRVPEGALERLAQGGSVRITAAQRDVSEVKIRAESKIPRPGQAQHLEVAAGRHSSLGA